MKSTIWQYAESNASVQSPKLFLFPKWTRHFSHRSYPPLLYPRHEYRIDPTSISKNQIKVWLLCEETYRKRPVTFLRNFQQQNHWLPGQMVQWLMIDREKSR